MTQYINKDALVAEIERRKQVAFGWMETAPNDAIEAEFKLCDDILFFINTLEVKEVDLNEAARKWEDKVYLEKGWQDEYGTPHAPFSEIGNAFREGAKFILKTQKGE